MGPRLGRFNSTGKVRPFKSASIALSCLGVVFLWLGWWGFNGGSTFNWEKKVGLVILNTNLSAAAAGLFAFVHCSVFQNRSDINAKFLGGILGGLVAITACSNVVTPWAAILVGCSAGLVHNLGYDFLLKGLKLDDPVGAIPVHGFCGVWGTLCVALFGKEELLIHGRWEQFLVQLLGVAVCFVWTISISLVMYKVLKATIGLRVSPIEEKQGINLEPLQTTSNGDVSSNGQNGHRVASNLSDDEFDYELKKLLQE